MARLLVIVFHFVAACGLLPAAPVPPDAGRSKLHFPTRVGTKWVYALKGLPIEGYGQVVTHSEEKGGRYLVTIKSTSVDFKDDKIAISQYEVSAGGIFLVAEGLESLDTRMTYERPECVFKLPHKVGEEWGGNAGKGEPTRTSGKVERVEVPAGTFEAIRIDQGEDYTFWWAPNVGLVKKKFGKLYLEMKSFTLPKE